MQAQRTSKTARRIENAVRSVLPASVDVSIIHERDASVDLKVAGHRLRARWLDTAWPKAVRLLLAKHDQRPDVLVAQHLSIGTREALSKLGVGWVDEGGAAEIAIGTLVVSLSGRAAPVKRIRGWTPSVLAVAEALLCKTTATVAATQEATGLSTGTCTNALRVLTEMKLLIAHTSRGRASARHVTDLDGLLAAYASAAANEKPPQSVVVGVTWRDPIRGVSELGERWSRAGLDWAATGLVAAGVLAPLQTTIGSATIYVTGNSLAELIALAAKADLRPIEGGRLTLSAFPTSSTRRLATTVEGMRVAPWPRVYVDLRTIGVRGEEAAEHLREVVNGT